ncbi:MAG: hypothetical protein FWC76_08385, partial [Defluviitaleaceae bacterium]|nr:hypothetical protein [Defluviitaleaceae bacterium]
MRKVIAKSVVLLVMLVLAACDGQSEYQPEAEIEIEMIESTPIPAPSPAPTPAPQGLSWQETYAALLLEYSEKPSPTYWLYDARRYFILYDIDKDGIPELMIFYLAAGFNPEAIYTYRDGEVIPIEGGFFLYYAMAYANPKGAPGIILANTLRHPSIPDAVSYTLMAIDGNKLVRETVLTQAWEDWYQWWDEQEVPREAGWYINDRKVTQAEFYVVYDSIFRGWDGNNNLFPAFVSEENIKEMVFGWTEPSLAAIALPVRQISLHGIQMAIDFLSGFQSIFQSTKGFHDYNTGGFYAWSDGEWANIETLAPSEIPLVFQGGVRYGAPDNWLSDTWGAFFGNTFY